jgi:hypothetical protein
VSLPTISKAQYGYASGSANTIRPTTLTYPHGRVLTYDYGAGGGKDDAASRVAELVDPSGDLAQYQYLGLTGVVEQTSPEADLRYTLVSPSGSTDPDTGDIYAGLDRFGRVKVVRWRDVSAAADLSRVQYGYDRASNRTWRENPSDSARRFDWLYRYDGLHRLKDGTRGTLVFSGSQPSALSSPQFQQCWTLDATGNWQGFRQDDDGGGTWDTIQSRTANTVNEITALTNSPGPAWATPAYDAAGNMTTIPRTDPAALAWATLSVDQWSTLTVDDWAGLPVVSAYLATYDAWHRLTKLTHVGDGSTAQENQYDARGYRTVARISSGPGLSTLDSRHFYYSDRWQVLEERLGTSTTPDRQFTWGVRYIILGREKTPTISPLRPIKHAPRFNTFN